MSVPPELMQAMHWLKQRLAQLGGAQVLIGVDVGRLAMGGKVGYGIRIYAKPEGVQWLKQYGFPGLVETPYGSFYAAVLGPESVPRQPQRPSQPAPQPPGTPQPTPQPGVPQPQAPKAEDPYAGWNVEYHGTELEGATVKHYGSEIEDMRVEVHGTKGVKPKPAQGGEFRIKSGCFGTTFSQFEPEE